MSGFRIEGNSSGNVAEVTTDNNLNVTLPMSTTTAGYSMLSGEIGAASDPTGRIAEKLRVSGQDRLETGQLVPLLYEVFNYTTVNSAIFTVPVTTMTVTAASGTVNLNASAITTTATVARISTYQYFPILPEHSTYCMAGVLLTQTPQTNNVIEIGFIICSGTTAPTDGAFFRYDNAGNLKAVLNINGTETTSAVLTTPAFTSLHDYKIVISNNRALYYIDGALQAVIARPNNSGFPVYSAYQPFTVRTYNSGVPSLAQVVKISYVYVGLQDLVGLGKSFNTIAAFAQKMGSQGQSGQTMGSTALYSNSLAPGAGAAMTNTTAALGSGLGGQFSALPTLAANTDGIVCSYQNPAATSAVPGKVLYISGVKIQSMVTTVLAGGPIYYMYSLAYGHTTVSLATAESATAKAPRRVPIGIETFAATAAVGTLGSNGISLSLQNPIAVNPGEFVQVVAKNVGTVTTTGVVTFLISFDAYWE